ANGDLECRAGAQRRLLEEQRDVTSAQDVCRRRASQTALGLHLRGDGEQAIEVDRTEIEDRQEILGERDRSNALHLRSVFAVDADVLGAEIAAPDRGAGAVSAPEIDV